MKKIAASILAGLTLAASGFALPILQLDVSGSKTYDEASQTIIANSSSFDVFALLNSSEDFDANDKYTLVAALTPRITQEDPTLDVGSFLLNGNEIDAVADMDYGMIDGLEKHGIYETYYTVLSFDFTDATSVPAYNSEPGESADGVSTLLRKSFTVDVSGLSDGYEIHFDLIGESTEVVTNGNGKKTTTNTTIKAAPYSHDAESGSTSVPEPATLSLLGLSLLVTGFVSRKKKQA